MIDGKLHTEMSWNKRRIVIDACEVHRGYEVMTLYKSSGKEIECKIVDTIDEAEDVYNDMVERYGRR